MAKKRLKKHVHRSMTKRLQGCKKSKKGLLNDSKKKKEQLLQKAI